jgi:hypothetical protein
MRKTTKQTVSAFINGEKRKVNNTESTGDTLLLFGKVIAWRADGEIYCTLAGYGTPTTRERLNGLFYMLKRKRPFHQVNHEQMFDGEPIGTQEIIKVTGDWA